MTLAILLISAHLLGPRLPLQCVGRMVWTGRSVRPFLRADDAAPAFSFKCDAAGKSIDDLRIDPKDT
jgi:hypothetical protein